MMVTRRLARLQRHSLRCVLTQDQCPKGVIAMGHRAWVQTWGQEKSPSSHSLYTLAARGLIVLDRTPGGKADALPLTAEGRTGASQLPYSGA